MIAGCFQDGWVISATGASDIALSFLPFIAIASETAQKLTTPQGFQALEIAPKARMHNVKHPSLTWKSRATHGDKEQPLKVLLLRGARVYLADTALAWLELYLSQPDHPFVKALLAYQQSTEVLHWQLSTRALDLSQPQIMGILNLSPDSFSEGLEPERLNWQAKASLLLENGADILDIGAETTRPGASPITVEKERQRLRPCLESLNQSQPCPISVDTYHLETVQWLAESGLAEIVNDIGRTSNSDRRDRDTAMLKAVKDGDLAYIMMAFAPHDAEPLRFEDCLRSIVAQLSARLDLAFDIGLDLRRIIVDPGIGFGKGLDNDIRLVTKATPALACLGRPVLIGHSRKRCLGQATGRALEDREKASLISAAFALHSGASIVRLHQTRYANDARTLAAIYRDTP